MDQQFAGVSLHGIDRQLMGDEAAAALHAEGTGVLEREQIARRAYAGFDIRKIPKVASYLEQKNMFPAWMREKDSRREGWGFLFEKNPKMKAFQNGQNGAIRRNTEIALDNTLSHLVETYLPGINYPHLSALKRNLTPQSFCEHFMFGEGADITQYPAHVLGLVRQLIPLLISRQIFSYFSVDTPSARIPVLEHLYGQDHAPFTLDQTDLFFLTPGENDFYYSGGTITGLEIGVGDNAEVNFDLPISETRNHEVYVNGVFTDDYVIGVGAGVDGRDRIQFNFTPAQDHIIVVSFSTSVDKGEAGREVDMRLRMVTMTDDCMVLTARWDIKDEQDALAFHNIQVSPEMSQGMMLKIHQDLEAHVIRNALNQATGGDAIWFTDGYLAEDTNSLSRFAYEETINELFVDAAQFLFRRYGRYPTWAVVGEDIATRLSKLKKFQAWPAGPDAQTMEVGSVASQTPVGIFNNRWIIYQSPAGMPSNRMLMGWTPATPFDVTYAVGIFLPFYTTGAIPDGQGRLRKYQTNMMRYGEVVVKPEQMSTGSLQTSN